MKQKKLKLVETGYEDKPCVITIKEEKNQFRIDASNINGYLRLTKKQAERLARFLLNEKK